MSIINWFRKKPEKEIKERYAIMLNTVSCIRCFTEGQAQTEIRPGQFVQWNGYKSEFRKESGGIKSITYVATEDSIHELDTMGSYPAGGHLAAIQPKAEYILLCLFKEEPKPFTLLDIDDGYLVNSSRTKPHNHRLDMTPAFPSIAPIKHEHETVEGLWFAAVLFYYKDDMERFLYLQKEADDIIKGWS